MSNLPAKRKWRQQPAPDQAAADTEVSDQYLGYDEAVFQALADEIGVFLRSHARSTENIPIYAIAKEIPLGGFSDHLWRRHGVVKGIWTESPPLKSPSLTGYTDRYLCLTSAQLLLLRWDGRFRRSRMTVQQRVLLDSIGEVRAEGYDVVVTVPGGEGIRVRFGQPRYLGSGALDIARYGSDEVAIAEAQRIAGDIRVAAERGMEHEQSSPRQWRLEAQRTQYFMREGPRMPRPSGFFKEFQEFDSAHPGPFASFEDWGVGTLDTAEMIGSDGRWRIVRTHLFIKRSETSAGEFRCRFDLQRLPAVDRDDGFGPPYTGSNKTAQSSPSPEDQEKLRLLVARLGRDVDFSGFTLAADYVPKMTAILRHEVQVSWPACEADSLSRSIVEGGIWRIASREFDPLNVTAVLQLIGAPCEAEPVPS